MTLTFNSVFWLLFVVLMVVGIIGLINAFRDKMRELAERHARAAKIRLGRYHPNPDRAARRSKPA